MQSHSFYRKHFLSLTMSYAILASLAGSLAPSAHAVSPRSREQRPTAAMTSTPRSVLVYGDADNHGIRQLATPDFQHLSPQRRLFVYYLAQAIEAGRDIAWMQLTRDGLAIRQVMEDILRQEEALPPKVLESLTAYFIRLNKFHGNYNSDSGEKFVPKDLTQEEFLSALSALERRAPNAGLMARALPLLPSIFDPTFAPHHHGGGIDPQTGKPTDLVGGSNSGMYPADATEAEIRQSPKRWAEGFLTTVVRKKNGRLGFRIQRLDGQFGPQLARISKFLKEAQVYATADEKRFIDALMKANRTGSVRDVKAAETLWVQMKSPDIEFMMGFIEVYEDPLGARGSWEGFVFLKNQDPDVLNRIANTRAHFFDFEETTPFDPEFRKTAGSVVPQSESASLVFTGGANGESPFAGVNLPNWPEIQRRYGSKSFSADNVMNAVEGEPASLEQKVLDAFVASRYHNLMGKFPAKLLKGIQVEFHEILGHGSGKVRPGITDQHLKELHPPHEEARAEIASLYHFLGPVSERIGLLQTYLDQKGITDPTAIHQVYRDFALASVVDFFTLHFRSYSRLSAETTKITQAHQRGRQMMLNYLVSKGALSIERSATGIPRIIVENLDAVYTHLGALWKDIQRHKSTGDYDGAKKLFDAYDYYDDTYRSYRRHVVEELRHLGIPQERGFFLNPKFQVFRDEEGELVDVNLVYEDPSHFARNDIVHRMMERSDGRAMECDQILQTSQGTQTKPVDDIEPISE